MMAAHKFRRWEISSSSTQLASLFAETMRKGQITFTEWNHLIADPVDNSFTSDDEDVLTRMIYGVRHGFVKVV